MNNSLEEKRNFEADVVERAYKDAEFRAALRDDAKATLTEAYGREVPWDIEIHSDSIEKMHLVLPLFEDEMGELNEEQLETVAGGIMCGWTSGGP